MTVEGVDYAGSRPSPVGLYAAGKRFVVRYGGPGGTWKHLTAAEADALRAAGLSIVANAEGSTSGLLAGRTAGRAWALEADTHFRTLGMPADRPIYFSADWDTTSAQYDEIDAALRGAAEVVGAGRVGVYGEYDVIAHCKAAGTARWFWQTYGWSQGRWHPAAHLQQYRNRVSLAGGTVDLDRATVADYGQWGQGDIDMPLTNADAELVATRTWFRDTDPDGDVVEAAWVALHNARKDAAAAAAGVAALRAQLAEMAGRDLVDEPAIVAGVLAGLSPQAIADLVVMALPPDLARQLAVDLAARLQA